MSKSSTETTLQNWRYGQTMSERLCAGLLIIDGFESVDPQSPLGGRDGIKDVLFSKKDLPWIAACYFATTEPNFSQVNSKFTHDLKGVKKNEANGIAFFVNQHITPGNRTILMGLDPDTNIEIYHLERMRALLDSPKGYGLRLEYLQIPMNTEEQLGFFSTVKDDISSRFDKQEQDLSIIRANLAQIMNQTSAILADFPAERSTLLEVGETTAVPLMFPTSTLSVSQVIWIHRMLTDDSKLPYVNRGQLRNVFVWIGPPGTAAENARFTPPAPEYVNSLLEQLLKKWRNGYFQLMNLGVDEIVKKLSTFHHEFVSIHPFLDANGRIARAILQQQSRELLNLQIMGDFSSDPLFYYDALSQADKGNLNPLNDLVRSMLG